MRPFSLLVAAVLALGACAPQRAASGGPAAVPPPPRASEAPARTTPPADAAAPAEPAARRLTAAPERWWLLDAESDGVRGTSVERAYRELLAGKQPRKEVVVAIIDSGVDVEHEDLKANVWTNPRRGGASGAACYTGDAHGWNFIGGKDGRNVEQDSYEVTRVYARYRRYEGANPDTLSATGRTEFSRYQEAKAEWEAKRAENEEMLGQLHMMKSALDGFYSLLRQQLGTDSLTEEKVAAIRSPRADVRRAQQVYLQAAAEGITPAVIDKELERVAGLTERGLNPDFDPRPIVGDRYDDTSERCYGNADVQGPDAQHGTHVAGIIGAVRGNGVGIEGIAPSVRLMSIRAVPDGDERDKDIANAIRYAVDNGAQIINMSFGKAFSPEKGAVDAAVRYADQKGVLMVHAAGNDSKDLARERNFPTRYFADGDSARLWIEVGASSWRGAEQLPATFSNYGKREVHLFAPGDQIRSTVPGNRYEALSGTSMAAPVVSGVAALLMAYYPELSAADVKKILLESATRYANQTVVRPGEAGGRVPFGELSATGGVVNAYAAVRMAEQMVAARRN